MTHENLEPFQERVGFDVSYINEEETFVLYCLTCRTVLYKGNDQSYISLIVRDRQIDTHQEAYSEEHEIEIVV